MTHNTPNAIAERLPERIACSANVQTAIGLLMTAIRHEAKQRGVCAGDTLDAIDRDSLSAEIELLIVKRFTQVLSKAEVK